MRSWSTVILLQLSEALDRRHARAALRPYHQVIWTRRGTHGGFLNCNLMAPTGPHLDTNQRIGVLRKLKLTKCARAGNRAGFFHE
jgi:hypothetical protein